jgi:DNA-binding winged helix-turn-helix (wHTH) protein
VNYVRRKLEAAGCPSPIETVRGVGYRFDPESLPDANATPEETEESS